MGSPFARYLSGSHLSRPELGCSCSETCSNQANSHSALTSVLLISLETRDSGPNLLTHSMRALA